MTLPALEQQILEELKALTGRQDLTADDLLSWSPRQLKPYSDDKVIFLQKLQLYCSVRKQPAPS